MKIELKKFGEVLISRPAGREAFLALSAYQLRDVSVNEPIEIDFEGVKVMGPSWTDEVVTKVAEHFSSVRLLNTQNPSVQATLKILREYSGLKIIQ